MTTARVTYARTLKELYVALDATWERTRAGRRLTIAEKMDEMLLQIEEVMAKEIAAGTAGYVASLQAIEDANAAMDTALETRASFNQAMALVDSAIASVAGALT